MPKPNPAQLARLLAVAVAALLASQARELRACSCAPEEGIDHPAADGAELPPGAGLIGRGIGLDVAPTRLTVAYTDGARETITGTVSSISFVRWRFVPTTPFGAGRSVVARLTRTTGAPIERTFTIGSRADADPPTAVDPTGLAIVRDVYAETRGRATSCDAFTGPGYATLRFANVGALVGRAGELFELYLRPKDGSYGDPYSVDLGRFALPTWSCAEPEPCSGIPGFSSSLRDAEEICVETRVVDPSGNASPRSPERCYAVSDAVHTFDFDTHTCVEPSETTRGAGGCSASGVAPLLAALALGVLGGLRSLQTRLGRARPRQGSRDRAG